MSHIVQSTARWFRSAHACVLRYRIRRLEELRHRQLLVAGDLQSRLRAVNAQISLLRYRANQLGSEVGTVQQLQKQSALRHLLIEQAAWTDDALWDTQVRLARVRRMQLRLDAPCLAAH
jgi:hypothetical protein